MKDVQWKGKTQTVEYDLFRMMVSKWVSEGMTKEEVLDLMLVIYNVNYLTDTIPL